MLEAPTIPAPSARAAVTSAGLVLRIRGTAHDGRLLKITAATCTIGSDPQCTLRLRSPGIDPLHCVLTQDSGRAIATSGSLNTQLNGQTFDESTLHIGDRLTVGPIHLEVVGGAEEASNPRSTTASPSLCVEDEPPVRSPTTDTDDLDSERQQLQAERATLELQRQNWTAEQEQGAQELAGRRKALDHFAVHLERLQHDLNQKQNEWQGRQQDLDAQWMRLQDERLSLEASIRDRSEGLDRAQADFEQQRGAIDDLRRQLETREADLARRQADLDGHIADLDDKQADLQRVRAELSAERQSLEYERTSAASERASLQSEWQRLENERHSVLQQETHLVELRQEFELELAAAEDSRRAITLGQVDLDQQRAAMAAERAIFEQHRQALVNERLEWQAETAQAESVWNGRQQRFDEQLKLFDRQNAELAQERTSLEKQQAAHLQNLAAFEQQSVLLEEQERSLFDRINLFQTERTAVEALRIELEGRQTDLDQRAIALDQREQTIPRVEAELRTHQEAAAQLDQRLGERHQSLDEQQRRLDEQRNSLDQRRAQLEAERQSLDAGHAALECERRAVNEARNALDADRQTLESERNAWAEQRQESDSVQQQKLARDRESAQRIAQQDAQITQQERQLVDAADQLGRASAEIEQQKKVLDAAQAELARERQLRANAHQRLEAEHAAHVADLQAELDSRIVQAKQAAATDEQERQRYEKRVADLSARAEELHKKTQAIADERDRLQDERRRLESDRQGMVAKLAEEHAQLDRERQALKQQSAEHDHEIRIEREAMDAMREALEQLRHQPAPIANSASDEYDTQPAPDDQLGVLASEHLDIDDDQSTPPDAEFTDQSETHPEHDSESGPTLSPAARLLGENDAIDDYMTQLLNRVRGTSAADPISSSLPAQRYAARNDESGTDQTAPEHSSDDEAVLSRLIPRAVAPELSSDLRAMRDLANMSARTAIDRHEYRNWGRAAVGKLIIAVLAAGTGLAALYFAPAGDPLLTYAGWASMVVALFWLLQAGILTCSVVIASRRSHSFAAGEPETYEDSQSVYENHDGEFSDQDETAPEFADLGDEVTDATAVTGDSDEVELRAE